MHVAGATHRGPHSSLPPSSRYFKCGACLRATTSGAEWPLRAFHDHLHVSSRFREAGPVSCLWTSSLGPGPARSSPPSAVGMLALQPASPGLLLLLSSHPPVHSPSSTVGACHPTGFGAPCLSVPELQAQGLRRGWLPARLGEMKEGRRETHTSPPLPRGLHPRPHPKASFSEAPFVAGREWALGRGRMGRTREPPGPTHSLSLCLGSHHCHTSEHGPN